MVDVMRPWRKQKQKLLFIFIFIWIFWLPVYFGQYQ